MARTTEEVIAQIEAQLGFLRRSGAAFDDGDLAEAVRIATTVCVLVEDGRGRIKSVLTQAGVLSTQRFLASGRAVNPANMLPEATLVLIRLKTAGGAKRSASATYLPRFDDFYPRPPRLLPFGEWWNEPILRTQDGAILSRQKLARSLRDQEGGSHFDEELSDRVYIRIVRHNAVGWMFHTPEGSGPIDPEPHLASMRQIGWEVEQTLADVLDRLRAQGG